jgi:hypothetical protein
MSRCVEIREGCIKKGGLNPPPVGDRPPPPKSHAPPGIKECVAKIQTLRREYDNAMLNEDLDSYDDLLDAVKDVLIELGYPSSIHDDTKAGT